MLCSKIQYENIVKINKTTFRIQVYFTKVNLLTVIVASYKVCSMKYIFEEKLNIVTCLF